MRDERPRHNLPAQLTSFVGRERELAEVRQLLAERRLLTLVGAPGVGKTRLALEAAADLTDAYSDGVWLVELAALADPALVSQALAAAVEVREQPGRDMLASLVDALRQRQMLLVLDNCEHLIEACAALAEQLLRACPILTILATSREPLGIPGETTWPVLTLAVPEPEATVSVSTMEHSEAAQLFVDRAGAVVPGFALSAQNVGAVLQICRRLDGIPLAIELAAARVRGLTLSEIAAGLDDRFRLLAGGSRTASPRHRTLRSLVDWSHALLSEPEQVLFRRLAVFAGGWTVEAAEAVCAGDGVAADDVRDLLLQLVARSLVLADERAGRTRYRLLETLREYALEKLRAAGEEAALRDRHRDWCLALAEQAEPQFMRAEAGVWLDRLQVEHDNLRAALTRSAEAQDAGALVARLAGSAYMFWRMLGHHSEGRRWLDLALDRASEPAARIKVLHAAADLAFFQSDSSRARELWTEAVALGRASGDTTGVVLALARLAFLMTRYSGDYEQAMALSEESLALARRLGDPVSLAVALHNCANVAFGRGDLDRAWADWEAALELFREAGLVSRVAHMLNNLGSVAAARGELGRASALCEEVLPLWRQRADRFGLRGCLVNLLRIAQGRGDAERVPVLAQEALALAREVGSPNTVASVFESLAWVARVRGDPARAARLLGAAQAIRERLGLRLPETDRRAVEAERTALGATLGGDAFAAARAEGAAMPLEQAIEYALAAVEPTAAVATGTTTDQAKRRRSSDTASPLTAREREVAALIARGLTNHQIAAELVVADRTVDAHIRNILGKLGFASRAQVAAWAAERGLTAPRP